MPVCRACLSAPEPLAAEYFCVSCRTPFQNHFPLDAEGRCALCRSGLRGFDLAYCFGAYEGTLRQLIHLYKYGRMKPLAKPLGDLLARPCRAISASMPWSPVPLHWRRKWDRGFNQSELLARSIASRCGLPLLHPVRRRRSHTGAGWSEQYPPPRECGGRVLGQGRRASGLTHSADRRCHDHRRHRQRLRAGA